MRRGLRRPGLRLAVDFPSSAVGSQLSCVFSFFFGFFPLPSSWPARCDAYDPHFPNPATRAPSVAPLLWPVFAFSMFVSFHSTTFNLTCTDVCVRVRVCVWSVGVRMLSSAATSTSSRVSLVDENLRGDETEGLWCVVEPSADGGV